MSKQLEWAQSYAERYESWLKQRGTSGSTVTGGVESQLYDLALAVIADATDPSVRTTDLKES